MCVCTVCINVGVSDAERARLAGENERLRCAVQRAEAAMKQAMHDGETTVAVMQTRCQVHTLGMQ